MPSMRQDFYYNSFFGALSCNNVREFELMNELNKIKKGQSMLEVGCAQGHFLNKLEKKGVKSYGVDYRQESLESANEKCGSTILARADAQKLPFKDNSFDWVLCTEVLEHVPNWHQALDEIKRVAREKIILTIPMEHRFWWSFVSVFYPMRSRGHIHSITPAQLESEMKPWNLDKKRFINVPSVKLNRVLAPRFGETLSWYSLFSYSNGVTPK